MMFSKLAFALFTRVDSVILPNCCTVIGVGIVGMNIKNEYGTLYIISEAGGNETGTDYNAVFLRHPQTLSRRLNK